MLPYSLTNGWAVVGDGKSVPFEACWHGEHVVGHLEANSDEVTITLEGQPLVIRLDVFEQLATRAIIAAHTTPGGDRG